MMKKLNSSTIKIIGSSYTISNVEALVKELVENSLDAKSTHVVINLQKYGLERIDVIDDGEGIGEGNSVCRSFSTSKISDFNDIVNVKTFGFRGQVLASICAISNLTIISNCSNESTIGSKWVYGNNGEIIASTSCACKRGCTVSVANLFFNLPVRRQLYKSLYELQKSHQALCRYLRQLYISRPGVHIRLSNDGNTELNLPLCHSLSDAISNVVSSARFGQLTEHTWIDDSTVPTAAIEWRLFIANGGQQNLQHMSHVDYREVCYLFVNDRPTELPSLLRSVRDSWYLADEQGKKPRYPLLVMFLRLPPSWVDVNIDPDKRRLRVQHLAQLCRSMEAKVAEIARHAAPQSSTALHQDSPEFHMGQLAHIPEPPVLNINLKRPVDQRKSPFKRRKLDSPPKSIEVLNSNDPSRVSATLSSSADRNSYLGSDTAERVLCWNVFVIVISDHMVKIFSKRDLLAASIFLEQAREKQIPAEKVAKSIVIDVDRHRDLKEKLDNLPQQLISNNTTGQKFRIVSCPHLLKNGFRIHANKTDSGETEYELVTRPPFLLADGSVLTEVNMALTGSGVTGKGCLKRPPAIAQWLRDRSEDDARQRLGQAAPGAEIHATEFWRSLYTGPLTTLVESEALPVLTSHRF